MGQDPAVQNKIKEFISVAKTMDNEPVSKSEAEFLLAKNTKNLTPAQKEFLQNVVTNLRSAK
jgi:hypothetical protein